jgi:hypothetical protein
MGCEACLASPPLDKRCCPSWGKILGEPCLVKIISNATAMLEARLKAIGIDVNFFTLKRYVVPQSERRRHW